mmetsp:Transcript_7111/g.20940  ORF Transcript_7111/g.20940 Transcript_7111/m.20940 type:complete len:202 (-) Transcript_7111:61-666(-)
MRVLVLALLVTTSSSFLAAPKRAAPVTKASAAAVDDAPAEADEVSLPKSMPGTRRGEQPGDRGTALNYGATVATAGLASALLIGSALPQNYVPAPAGPSARAERAALVARLVADDKVLAKQTKVVGKKRVEVEVEVLPFEEKMAAVALGAAPFAALGVAAAVPLGLKAYDLSKTGERLYYSADAGRRSAKAASRALRKPFE